MKNLEEKLDKDFEKLRIKPRIFHFVGDNLVFPYAGITIVSTAKYSDYKRVLKYVNRAIDQTSFSEYHNTGFLKLRLNDSTWGAAICDKRDVFNRRLGRVIAKGRLLKRLREEVK